ncbi:uncharacterized protein LOC143375318 isoform X3 [Andrena cerasifolii]
MTAGSRERMLLFVKGLKDELVRKSYDNRIFLVLPTKPDELAKQFDLKELSKYVDLFTVPTHYLMEDDEAYHTFHPSRLMGLFDMFNADSLIDLISGLGAPKKKILVSVPASAYRFTLKDQDDNAPRAPTEELQPVIIDQKQLCDSMSKDEWTIERDEDLTGPYAFKGKMWIAFEDKISVAIKGKYALIRELPGLGIRNIENDIGTSCGKPLTHEIHHSFTDFKRKSRAAVLNSLEDDLHQTQISYPTKVKSSEFRVVRVVNTEGKIRAVRENTQTEFTCSRQGYFVHPKSCNRFYRCVKFNQEVEDYSVFEFDCPAGLAFDERTEVCVWPGSLPQGSPCPGSSEIAPVARVRFECPSKPGYYADPQNPRWFFACIDLGEPEMMAYEFRCPYGLIFDEHRLVCEWPWLVPGYSDSEYTKTTYDNRGYGGQTTQGADGYYTGGVSHGYSGETGSQGGVYTGTTAGVGYSGIGSTVATGGYSGHSGFSGAAGVGYAGSTIGSHGTSYDQGSNGYSGTAGGGYFGSTTGAGKGTYSGSGSTGTKTGSIGGGYGSSIGPGYAGSGNTGYSGSTNGVYAGAGGTKYSGAAGAGQASTGSGYAGTGSTVHVGTGGTYNGAAGTDYAGSAHFGGGGLSGDSGNGYTGTTYSGHGTGSGYSGTTSGVHGGSAGSGYTGSGTGSTGSVGGYSGSTSGVHAGAGGTGYTGSTGGYNAGTGHTGSVTGGFAGSIGGGYAGSTSGAHAGAGGTGYTGSTGGYNAGAGHTGFATGGYAGSTTGAHAGASGTGYTGSTGGYNAGSTSGTGHTGSVTGGYAGSIGGGYSGPTSGFHGGSAQTGYVGPVTGGYAGSTSGVHVGSGGTDYAVATGGYVGSTGSHAGSPGTGYTVSTGGYAGSTGGSHVGGAGTEYSGPSISPGYPNGEYSGSGTKGGSSGVQYSGPSHGSTIPGVDYSGTSVSGASDHGHSFQTGTQYAGAGAGAQGGHTITYGTQPSQTPIYASAGTTGSGTGSIGVIGVEGQTSGPVFPQKPDGPSVNCVFNCLGTGQQEDKTYITDGYVTNHGLPSGTVFPGQSGVTTTYFGNSGTKGYGQGVVTSGGTIYQGGSGYTGGLKGVGDTGHLNVTLIGSGGPSIGSTTYHGVGTPTVTYGIAGTADTGAIVTGHGIHGSVLTGDSTPGTIIAYGNTPGTVLSGSSDQGAIVTGGTHPGYTKTGTGTPGYVISGGVKTVYPGSASPGTAVYGTPSPGVLLTGPSQPGTIIKGESTPGIVLTGQTAPGVSLSGPIDQGTVVGSTGHPIIADSGYSTQRGSAGSTYNTGIGRIPVTYDTGYKTNEYHDNGGRGTIKFNNGDITTKYTENDIPDYRPAGGTIPPDTLIPGYNFGVSGLSTPSGFTKTGPTKTGITTAALGGSGSYVISTGNTRPTLSPDNIGDKAFDGSVAGYTKSTTESNLKVYDGVTSTHPQDVSHVDTSKITLGPSKSTGYSYPKPSIAFETGVTGSSSTEGNVLTATTPTPFLNVEIYNTPKLVGSTMSPAVVNIYNGPTGGQYQGKVPTGFTHAPAPTVAPVYTPSPLDNYKTTAFEAAKIPVAISTVQPVIDTGFKTIGSPTSVPVTISQDEFSGHLQTGSVSSQNQYDFGRRTSQRVEYGEQDYISSTTPSSIFGVSSTYSPTQPRPFGPGIVGPSVTEQPQINYVSTTSSGSGYFDSSSRDSFGQSVTQSGISESLEPHTQYQPSDSVSPAVGVTYRKPFPLPGITYDQSTPLTPATSTDGSPTNVAISKDEVDKLLTNYNRGTTKYVPSEYDIYKPGSVDNGFSRTQSSSSSFGQSYGSSTPAPLGYTPSQYPSVYSKPSSVITYQTTAKSTAVGKAKVIVKWSDLHPLLLGKLGAECTCKGDPFANLRGPGSKLINSSKGKVDLSNYDESEIYVDLEKTGSYEDDDYVTNYESPSPGPVKIWNSETPAPSPQNYGAYQISEKPSSAYLPSHTPSANAALRGSASASLQGSLGGAPNAGYSANYRSGKSLSTLVPSTNSVASKGASFDRYGPGGLRDSEEVLEGATNCARPGLFRHPNFCNKFYACHWDEWKKKFTLHVFNCPVHLTFDDDANACNWPSMGPACQDDNLLV